MKRTRTSPYHLNHQHSFSEKKIKNDDTTEKSCYHHGTAQIHQTRVWFQHDGFPRMHGDMTRDSKVHDCKCFPGALAEFSVNIPCLTETLNTKGWQQVYLKKQKFCVVNWRGLLDERRNVLKGPKKTSPVTFNLIFKPIPWPSATETLHRHSARLLMWPTSSLKSIMTVIRNDLNQIWKMCSKKKRREREERGLTLWNFFH